MKAVIVDDDKSVVFLHELIVSESYERADVVTYLDAEEALDAIPRLAENGPCLVFLDINMPRISGWDFLQALDARGCAEHVWVVMVTSSVHRIDKEKAATFRRVVHFAEKPLTEASCDTLKRLPKLKPFFGE